MPILKDVFLNDTSYGSTEWVSEWTNVSSAAYIVLSVFCSSTVDVVIENAVDNNFQTIKFETTNLVGPDTVSLNISILTSFMRFKVINIVGTVDLKIQGYFYESLSGLDSSVSYPITSWAQDAVTASLSGTAVVYPGFTNNPFVPGGLDLVSSGIWQNNTGGPIEIMFCAYFSNIIVGGSTGVFIGRFYLDAVQQTTHVFDAVNPIDTGIITVPDGSILDFRAFETYSGGPYDLEVGPESNIVLVRTA